MGSGWMRECAKDSARILKKLGFIKPEHKAACQDWIEKEINRHTPVQSGVTEAAPSQEGEIERLRTCLAESERQFQKQISEVAAQMARAERAEKMVGELREVLRTAEESIHEMAKWLGDEFNKPRGDQLFKKYHAALMALGRPTPTKDRE